jgi:hypothetical protein
VLKTKLEPVQQDLSGQMYNTEWHLSSPMMELSRMVSEHLKSFPPRDDQEGRVVFWVSFLLALRLN